MSDFDLLTTPRLELRACHSEHAEDLFPAMHNPEVSHYLAWPPHQSVEETREVLESLMAAHAMGRGYHWTIFYNGQGCGMVSLIDVRRTHRLWQLHVAEIAYWLAPECQNRGLATEAVLAIVEAAFLQLDFNRLLIMYTSENIPSSRIPNKLGFRYVGYERQMFKKDERWYDMNRCELLRDDWLHHRRVGEDHSASTA